VSLFGGGTDFPGFFKRHGGLTVGMAIDKWVYVTARKLPGFFSEYKSRFCYSKIELVDDHQQIEHPVLKAVLSAYPELENVELHHFSDIPARSGMGSSSAFTLATLAILSRLSDKALEKTALINAAIQTERVKLAEAGGWQDQILCASSGLNSVRFFEDTWRAENVTCSDEYVLDLCSHFVMGYTGISRNSHASSEETQSKIAEQSIDEVLLRTLDIAERAVDLIQQEAAVPTIAALASEAWQLKREMASSLATAKFDRIYEKAIHNGAWAGKMLGAGGGGYFLFYVDPKRQSSFIESMSSDLTCWFSPKPTFGGVEVLDLTTKFFD